MFIFDYSKTHARSLVMHIALLKNERGCYPGKMFFFELFCKRQGNRPFSK